jgi:hypothetical protein
MQPSDVLVALKHARNAVVTPQDLLGLPLFALRVEERQEVSERLVEMQTESVVNFTHNLCVPFFVVAPPAHIKIIFVTGIRVLFFYKICTF